MFGLFDLIETVEEQNAESWDRSRLILDFCDHFPVPDNVLKIKDVKGGECAWCHVSFGVFANRNGRQCRLCGKLVCRRCCSKFHLPLAYQKTSTKSGLHRVCNACRDNCLIRKYRSNPRRKSPLNPVNPPNDEPTIEIDDPIDDDTKFRISRWIGSVDYFDFMEGDQRNDNDDNNNNSSNNINKDSLSGGRKIIKPPVFVNPKIFPTCFKCGRADKDRHHCRACGVLFCDDCSDKMKVPAGFAKNAKNSTSSAFERVCHFCRFRLATGWTFALVIPGTNNSNEENQFSSPSSKALSPSLKSQSSLKNLTSFTLGGTPKDSSRTLFKGLSMSKLSSSSNSPKQKYATMKLAPPSSSSSSKRLSGLVSVNDDNNNPLGNGRNAMESNPLSMRACCVVSCANPSLFGLPFCDEHENSYLIPIVSTSNPLNSLGPANTLTTSSTPSDLAVEVSENVEEIETRAPAASISVAYTGSAPLGKIDPTRTSITMRIQIRWEDDSMSDPIASLKLSSCCDIFAIFEEFAAATSSQYGTNFNFVKADGTVLEKKHWRMFAVAQLVPVLYIRKRRESEPPVPAGLMNHKRGSSLAINGNGLGSKITGVGPGMIPSASGNGAGISSSRKVNIPHYPTLTSTRILPPTPQSGPIVTYQIPRSPTTPI